MPSTTIPGTTTLSAIRTKVRRLTRSMSQNLLSDAEINNYINTFVVYDFPEHLRTFNLLVPFTFYCNAFQDQYVTDTSLNPANPLYNFQNKYLTIHQPVYIAGWESMYSQDRTNFFRIYPKLQMILPSGATGDGVTTTFTGFINFQNTGNPLNGGQNIILQKNVLFSSVDIFNNGLSMIDVPLQDTATGNPRTIGNLYVPGTEPAILPTVLDVNNNINYLTGEFTVTFVTPPETAVPINAQVVPISPSRPQALLYHNNVFTLRPVPDQPYAINFEAYARPDALLDAGQSPELEEYWQYIAYGASKKIFEDRMDMYSVQMIMPEFKMQELLCNRRTIVQYTNERTSTIYTEQVAGAYGPGWFNGGGNL